MAKLNLAVLDGDTRYMDNFAGYVAGHYRHRFNLLTFTSPAALLDYVQQKDSRADILLIAVEEYGDWLAKLETGLVILLARGVTNTASPPDGRYAAGVPDTPASSADGYARVDRYNGADKLVSDILDIYSRGDRAAIDTGDVHGGRENKIITVISAEGGIGKTTFAVALCAHFARLKLKTLYVSLDYMCGVVSDPEHDAGGGLSDLIYTVKTRPDRLGIKLEALGKAARGYGFYRIAPPIYPMDIDEIQPADIEALVARLRGAGLFDRVVVDTHSGLSSRNRTLMELSDAIAVVARCGAGIDKLLMLKAQIDRCLADNTGDLYKRCNIILNRARAEDAPYAAAEGLAETFAARVSVIPYCADICDDYNPETLAGISNSFGAAVAEIARRT